MTRFRASGAAIVVVALGLFVRAADDPAESGTFTLFKFAQAIGLERYQIKPDGDRYLLTSGFNFADRGTDVVLNTTFQFAAPLTPTRFTIRGDTARLSMIDEDVRQVPAGTFTLAGYAPVSMQMELLRYWKSHGQPASIALVPQGAARIEPRGRDTIAAGGRSWTLDRYSVSGVLWGRETLWADDAGTLQALVSVDAEFDHFEAVRPGLEDAVPQLIARAASDGMAAMAETAAAVLPAPSQAIAVTGGTVIDVEGKKRPLANATVLVTDGRITRVGPSASVAVPAGATGVDHSTGAAIHTVPGGPAVRLAICGGPGGRTGVRLFA